MLFQQIFGRAKWGSDYLQGKRHSTTREKKCVERLTYHLFGRKVLIFN